MIIDTTNEAPSGTHAVVLVGRPARPAGAALNCLSAWRRCRRGGADDVAREAALSGQTGPVATDPLSKEQ